MFDCNMCANILSFSNMFSWWIKWCLVPLLQAFPPSLCLIGIQVKAWQFVLWFVKHLLTNSPGYSVCNTRNWYSLYIFSEQHCFCHQTSDQSAIFFSNLYSFFCIYFFTLQRDGYKMVSFFHCFLNIELKFMRIWPEVRATKQKCLNFFTRIKKRLNYVNLR